MWYHGRLCPGQGIMGQLGSTATAEPLASSSRRAGSAVRHEVKSWMRGDSGKGQFGVQLERWDTVQGAQVAAADRIVR
jgi:hypothetical protein